MEKNLQLVKKCLCRGFKGSPVQGELARSA